MNSVRTKEVVQKPVEETTETSGVKSAAKVIKGRAGDKTEAKVMKSPVKEKSSSPVTISATSAGEKTKVGKVEKRTKVAEKKPKLVRDSFTFPEPEYEKIGLLKQRALTAGREIKKSELLRAGLGVLFLLPDPEFLKVVDGLDRLKSGRPAKT